MISLCVIACLKFMCIQVLLWQRVCFSSCLTITSHRTSSGCLTITSHRISSGCLTITSHRIRYHTAITRICADYQRSLNLHYVKNAYSRLFFNLLRQQCSTFCNFTPSARHDSLVILLFGSNLQVQFQIQHCLSAFFLLSLNLGERFCFVQCTWLWL